MPTLGADMEEGTLVVWHKQPGDHVTRGEIIAEVETDKASIEVEVFTTGVLEQLLVQPGDVVPVGAVMAVIKEDGVASADGGAARSEEIGSPRTSSAPSTPTASPVQSRVTDVDRKETRLKISPSARTLARELGVDPASVHGTGKDGAISRDDIQNAARTLGTPLDTKQEQVPAAAASAGDRQARMRQTIATAMARSKREIPHYYLSTTINMSNAMRWLEGENRTRSIADRLLYGVLLIKAVALALKEIPELNALWKEGRADPSPAIHVGVAISLRQGGLVAPALHDTDHQSLSTLMNGFRDLVKRARAGTLRSSEMSESTITVTSLGEQGVEAVYGVIYPPQVALVGFGKVVTRPWVVGEKICPAPVMTASLSADHRVSDGHRGGLFLAAVDRLLQEPRHL